MNGSIYDSSAGNEGTDGAIILTLVSYDAPVYKTVTITGGSETKGWFVYNGTTYTSGSADVMDGEVITVAGYSKRTITITLDGTNVASGRGASYELTVTANTTIAVSGSSSITIAITTA